MKLLLLLWLLLLLLLLVVLLLLSLLLPLNKQYILYTILLLSEGTAP